MSELSLFIDADSVPVSIRAVILRCIVRRGFDALFVADRPLRDVLQAKEEHTGLLRKAAKEGGLVDQDDLKAIKSGIEMVTVPTSADSADDYLVEHLVLPALAITHDVPLAARLVEKGAVVLDDRGGVFTRENIAPRLSERNINKQLREWGMENEKNMRMDNRQLKAFADALDRTLHGLTKNNRSPV
ncbi:MAG: DUF188 domain-containing protein [Sphaerochaetaceae bacterium]